MKNFVMVACLLALSGLTACGGTEQDPMATQTESVKNGVPPKAAEKPAPEPTDEDALKIHGQGWDRHFFMRQGVEDEVTIIARSTLADAKFKIDITNLEDFKGAVAYDPIEGDTAQNIPASIKFKWKPSSVDTTQDLTFFEMDVEAYTTNKDFVNKRKATVYVYVHPAASPVPSIVSVQKMSAMREGQKATFTVDVRDTDGIDFPGSRPQLALLPNYLNINGSSYLSAGEPQQDLVDPTLWHFNVVVDLTNIELTSTRVYPRFYVAAISRQGKKSPSVEGQYEVITSVSEPYSSWSTEVPGFFEGARGRYQFFVMDPKNEGNIAVNFNPACSTYPGAPRCSCRQPDGASSVKRTSMICTIEWTPTSADAIKLSKGQLNIAYEVKNTSPITSDTESKTKTFNGTIQVVQ